MKRRAAVGLFGPIVPAGGIIVEGGGLPVFNDGACKELVADLYECYGLSVPLLPCRISVRGVISRNTFGRY